MRTFLGAFRRLARDTAGGVAMMLALSLIPLTLAGIGALDLHRVVSAKSRLQDALDAAALAAARDSVADPTKLQQFGAEAFAQNLAGERIALVSGPTFTLTPERVVVADASARVDDTIVADLLLGSGFTVDAHAEVKSSGANIEVALVLDITGSMDWVLPGETEKKIVTLKTAARDLIDLVVQDQQPPQVPFYSKVALVPYAAAVNPNIENGSGINYANIVRGALRAGASNVPGYQTFNFPNAAGGTTSFAATNCVTERTIDGHEYDDVPYSTALVGLHYGPGCPSRPIVPLSSDKTRLKGQVDLLSANSNTSGHIGAAWGWYLISPRFMAQYNVASSIPAAYGTDKLFKVVVFMTDGIFNTAYCKGVAAKDSGDDPTGAGLVLSLDSQHINCKADNATSLKQTERLCREMKEEGIIIYTVGLFDGNYPSAEKVMTECATDNAHAYLPTSGVQLKDAFASIGADITKLRLSR